MVGLSVNILLTPGITTKRVENSLLPGTYFAEVSQSKERKLVQPGKIIE